MKNKTEEEEKDYVTPVLSFLIVLGSLALIIRNIFF
jgi:hypothetical protein